MESRVQAIAFALMASVAWLGACAQTPADDASMRRHLVFFPTGSTELTPAARAAVHVAAAQAAALRPRVVRVTGYAGATGLSTITQPLSEARANAVAEALVAEGVQRERLQVTARGESESTPGAGVADRQVEIELLQ